MIAKATLLTTLLLASAAAFADCPEGGRPTTPAEQQAYVSTTEAIRASLPPAPAGWRIKDIAAKFAVTAPNNVCKGSGLVAGYYVTYIWTEQEQRDRQRMNDSNARLRQLGLLTPEEQKQVDSLSQQARAFERQAVAVIRTNPDEAARLRAQAKPFAEQVNAIRQKHLESVTPQMDAIRKADLEATLAVNAEVGASISLNKESYTPAAGAERLQINGASSASYDPKQKELVFSLGRDASGSNLLVKLTGTRHEAETIANLIAGSSLNTVAKK
jgi:hypothetical protein